jgi:hypothetical protein
VAGVGELGIDVEAGEVHKDGEVVLRAGDRVGIDGTRGWVTLDDVPLVEARMSETFERVLSWTDALRTLGVETVRRTVCEPR